MIIKRPLTQEQKQALENDKPSEKAQLQAIENFINYVGLKLLDLEDKQNGNLSELQH